MIKNKFAFTLIELLAVIAILGVVAIIVVPVVSSLLSGGIQDAFKTDAKLLMNTIKLEIQNNDAFDPTSLSTTNLDSLLGLSASNYETLTVTYTNKNVSVIIRGKNKFKNLVAYGDLSNVQVVNSTETDFDKPVISLVGTSTVNVEKGGTYVEAGFTATDPTEGNLTSLVTAVGMVNTSVAGTYFITYDVKDSTGNAADSVIRTIKVFDSEGLAVAFEPNGNTKYLSKHSTNVIVTDNVAVNPSSLKYQWTKSTTAPTEASFSTTFTNNSSISTPNNASGGYYLWILAKDLVGNTSILRSNVFNVDSSGPLITITGSNPVFLQGSSYIDAGATAQDDVDGNLTSSIETTSNVNASLTGDYTVTYKVTDSQGNTSTAQRTVKIIKDVELLVVGGGGGGGMDMGGGGGGGAVITNKSYPITVGTTYNVRVGAGGAGAPAGGTMGNPSAHMFLIEAKNGGNSFVAKDISWGSSSSKPGKSCYSLMLDGETASGVYWIDPDQGGAGTPFQVYCDMEYDGGGWTMLLKATRGTTFNYAASYWTTANTLNDTQYNLNDGDAKFRSYNEMPVTDFMARWPDINSGNYRWVQNFITTARTPLNFFTSVSNLSGGTAKNNDNWGQNIFSSQGGATFYGFNFVANASNYTRWGFAWNNEGDWGSNDVGGGIGMVRASYSAGDHIGCCQDTTGMNRAARVEMYGRNSNDTADTTTSIVALGGGAGGSSYYNYSPGAQGACGGNGGGTSGYSNGNTRPGGFALSGQGYPGGQGGGQYYSGGGGGAGGIGTYSTAQPHGGPGKLSDILGTGYYFGGGGGGASYSLGTGGNGGLGGGGGGAVGVTYGGAGINNGSPGGGGSPSAQTNTPGGNGGANTGGGGGGGSHYFANNKGGDGGSGIVVIRYRGSQKADGGTVSTWNGYTIHKYTTVGDATFTVRSS